MKLIKSALLASLFVALSSQAQDYSQYAGNWAHGSTVNCSNKARLGGSDTLNWSIGSNGILKGTAAFTEKNPDTGNDETGEESWEIDVNKGSYSWDDTTVKVTVTKLADISTLSWLWGKLELAATPANVVAYGNPTCHDYKSNSDNGPLCANVTASSVWVFYSDANGLHHVIVKNEAAEADKKWREILFTK